MIRRLAVVSILLGVLAARSRAQPTSVIVAGRVIADATGDPLPHARVVLYEDATPLPPIFTDPNGRFSSGALPQGRYHLTATKSGYTPMTVTRLTPTSAEGVQVRMARSASISGRVYDTYGEPVTGMSVSLITPQQSTTNSPVIHVIKEVNTDDLGEYRLGALPAGTYLLSINQFSVDSTGGVVRATWYYPGTPSMAMAQPIVVAAGDQKAGVDFSGAVLPSALLNVPIALLQQLQVRINLGTPNQPKPPAGTGAIRGRITRNDGLPVARANITASVVARPGDAPNLTGPQNVLTDEDGRYEFTEVMRGQYRIRASKPGSIDAYYGQLPSADRGTPVDVEERQTRTQVDFVLPRHGAISGQVVDDFGDPVEGVSMSVAQVRFQSGRRRLVGAGTSQMTDDLGRYRIYGVSAGQYIVSGTIGQLNQGGAGTLLSGFAPTYFPGTTTPDEGRLVAVARSQDVAGVDFALVPLPTARITGSRIGSDGLPMGGSLQLTQSQRSGAIVTPSAGARIDSDGTFEFPNVTPGQYVIYADSGKRNTDEEGDFVAQLVTVNGADVNNVLLRATPGSFISGRVVFDGDPPPSFRLLTIEPTRADPDRTPLNNGSIGRAVVRSDLTFSMTGVHGPRRITVDRLPLGWMLKSVLAKGVDVTDVALPFGTSDESLSDVVVVLTNRVTQLSVSVLDARGQIPSECTVVVFSTDRDRWYPGSRFFGRMSTGRPDGRFGLSGLPPGDYYLAAVGDLPVLREGVDGWQDPQLLESLAFQATRATLTESQTLSLNLRLIAP